MAEVRAARAACDAAERQASTEKARLPGVAGDAARTGTRKSAGPRTGTTSPPNKSSDDLRKGAGATEAHSGTGDRNKPECAGKSAKGGAWQDRPDRVSERPREEAAAPTKNPTGRRCRKAGAGRHGGGEPVGQEAREERARVGQDCAPGGYDYDYRPDKTQEGARRNDKNIEEKHKKESKTQGPKEPATERESVGDKKKPPKREATLQEMLLPGLLESWARAQR